MPAIPLLEELAPEYRSVDQVRRSLHRLENAFLDLRDRRAVCAAALRLAAQGDHCPELTIATANLYRSALLAYEKGDSSSIPKSWKLAFDAACNHDALLVQDLFLGINAHVNHDWPIALAARPNHEQFTAMCCALTQATADIEARIEALYAPALRVLGRAFQPLARDITSFDLAKACQSASASVNHAAFSAVLARLILAPTSRKLVLDALRKIESVTPWWSFLAPENRNHHSDQSLDLHTLDDLIARLKEQARGSRMSIDSATQAEFCGKLKDALENGTFTDPAAITNLMLRIGSMYLRALASFEQNDFSDVPDCWYMAFQMSKTRENLLLQDVLAALNAHYNHDLPRAAAQGNSLPPADLERFLNLYRDHIIELEQSIVNRYAEAPILSELLTGPLQGILAEFPFDRALAQPPPDACAITQRILLKGLPGASWVVHALRHIESEWHRPPGRC